MEQTEHDLLIRIDERVGALNAKFDIYKSASTQEIKDLEDKIDGLPQWRHFAIGAGTTALGVGGWIVRTLIRGG